MAERVELRVPFATLLKIALAILLVLCVVKLWMVLLLVIFAILLAVMFDPLVGWLARHRLPRGGGALLVALLLFGGLAAFLFLLVPSMLREVGDVARQLPQMEARLARAYPRVGPLLQGLRGQAARLEGPQMRALLTRGMAAGMVAVEGVAAIVFIFVVAVYLLVEGRRAFAWLVSFTQPRTRERLVRTATEASGVVLAYVRGNVITSIICAAYVGIVLAVLHVPGVLLLTVLAFLFDFVPVVGFIIQIVPATALAMTISPSRALLVIGAYVLYHALENYVIVPRVYGKEMRLSTLTVVLSFAVGGTLQGVAGALLILPVVAAWPIVERIWLREKLPDDTIEMHDRLESEDGEESEEATSEVVDR
jgi:predicted PurR-regulated permease PerM